MKTKWILAVILLLLVAGAVVLLKTRKADLTRAPLAAVLPVVVEAVEVQPQVVTLTLPAMGVVASDSSTTLSTKISGRVEKIFKREGDAVRAGELIALIDAAELEARRGGLLAKIQGIDAELEAQRASHQRTLELFAVGGASLEQQQTEAAKIARLVNDRQSLRQNIQELEQLAGYARIISPVDGTLSAQLVMVGDLALPGKPLLKIAASEGLYLDVRLPSNLQAGAIRLEDQLFVLTAKNQAGPGGLREYRAALPLGGTQVEGEFLKLELVLFSGEGLLLPNDALLTLQGTTSVLVYQDGKAGKLPVTVIRRGSQGVMVSEDLRGKTLLLAKPDILLRATSGVPVRIRQERKVENGDV